MVALPVDNPLARRAVVPVRALRGESFVLFPRHLAPASYDVVIAMCRHAGFSPDIRHECADYQTMLPLVAAGLEFGASCLSIRAQPWTGGCSQC